MGFSWGRFDTRTIVLIPIAIAINIVLGQTVATVLKVPIYLDSIGTILVGVLAGPIPGLVTGLAHQPDLDLRAAATVAVGLRRAVRHRRGRDRLPSRGLRPVGFFRSRPNASWGQIARRRPARGRRPGRDRLLRLPPVLCRRDFTFFGDTSDASPFFVVLGYVIGIGIIARDRRAARAALRPARSRRRLRRDRRADLRHHLGDHLGADLGRRVRRRDRFRHGPPRRRVPAGRVRSPDRGPAAGPALRTRSTRPSTSSSRSSSCRPCRAGSSRASRRVRRRSAWRRRIDRVHVGPGRPGRRPRAGRRRPHRPARPGHAEPVSPAQPADEGGHRDRRLDRRVRPRRLRRPDRDHRASCCPARCARRRPGPPGARLAAADPADRHLGRARQRLHPGRHDRPLPDRAVRRDRRGRRLRRPDARSPVRHLDRRSGCSS